MEMKKRFIKFIAAITAGAVMMTTALISLPAHKTYAQENSGDVSGDASQYDSIPVSLTVNKNGIQNGGVSYNISGHARYVKIYVNGALYDTKVSYSSWGNHTLEETTVWDSFNWYVGMIPVTFGTKYTIRFEPYNILGELVESEVFEDVFTTPWPVKKTLKVNNSYINENSKGLDTGYGTVVRNIELSYDQECNVEVYRSLKKDSGFAKLAEVKLGGGNATYKDKTADPFKIYYYKFRIVQRVNGKTTYSPYTGVYTSKAYTVPKPDFDTYTVGSKPGITIQNAASKYEIFRSTKPTSGYKKIATTVSCSYVDKSAKTGVTYYYRVRSWFYNRNTNSSKYSAYSDIKAIAANNTTFNLRSDFASASSVVLRWDKNTSISKYEIYLKPNIAGGVAKYVGSTTGTSYKLSGLLNINTYKVYVKAIYKYNSKMSMKESIDINTKSLWADTKMLYTGRKIANGVATVTTKISWKYLPYATKIMVVAYDSKKNGDVVLKTVSSNAAGSYTFNNYKTNRGYRYSSIRVKATRGSLSEQVWCWAANRELAAVKNLKVVKKSSSSNLITWTGASCADSYSVIRVAPNGNTKWSYVTGTSYCDTNMTPGIKYTYTIIPQNSVYGLIGEEVSVSYTHSVSSTIINKASNTTAKCVSLTWNKVGFATSYQILRATSAKGTYSSLGIISASYNTYNDKKVVKGKSYYYKIVPIAENDIGVKYVGKASAYKGIKVIK